MLTIIATSSKIIALTPSLILIMLTIALILIINRNFKIKEKEVTLILKKVK